mgnify:CR=1 FL=1|tara:strand:- start:227 stop:475 length:249 start_codon:yes stop_codon:yes gene_type:complete
MNKEIIGSQIIYRKKQPFTKKKMPFKECETDQAREKKKIYYEPLYGTPACTYEGNKRGRKSMEERQRPSLKVEKKKIIMYFD